MLNASRSVLIVVLLVPFSVTQAAANLLRTGALKAAMRDPAWLGTSEEVQQFSRPVIAGRQNWNEKKLPQMVCEDKRLDSSPILVQRACVLWRATSVPGDLQYWMAGRGVVVDALDGLTLMTVAQHQYAGGYYASAARYYERLLKEDPSIRPRVEAKLFRSLLEAAKQRAELGEYESATELLKAALSLRYNDLEVLYWLERVQSARGDSREAQRLAGEIRFYTVAAGLPNDRRVWPIAVDLARRGLWNDQDLKGFLSVMRWYRKWSSLECALGQIFETPEDETSARLGTLTSSSVSRYCADSMKELHQFARADSNKVSGSEAQSPKGLPSAALVGERAGKLLSPLADCRPDFDPSSPRVPATLEPEGWQWLVWPDETYKEARFFIGGTDTCQPGNGVASLRIQGVWLRFVPGNPHFPRGVYRNLAILSGQSAFALTLRYKTEPGMDQRAAIALTDVKDNHTAFIELPATNGQWQERALVLVTETEGSHGVYVLLMNYGLGAAWFAPPPLPALMPATVSAGWRRRALADACTDLAVYTRNGESEHGNCF